MPKICFYCARYDQKPMQTEPLGIGYLAAYLIQQGICSRENIRIVENIDEAIAFMPDIVVVSSVTQVINDAKRFAKKCRDRLDCKILLGGYHISCMPEKLTSEFDVGILGEGEITFAEIVNLIKNDNFSKDSVKPLKGICFLTQNGVQVNPPQQLIADVDSLPYPLRYREYPLGMSLFTSRGCAYRCIFCASHKLWKGKFRLRSADSVVDEIACLVENFRPKTIRIMDDLWMFDKKRFREIVDKLVDLKIPEQVSFTGFCRSNIIQEEDILLLKKMNYKRIRFGVETGSEQLLRRLKGKNISVKDHQRVIDLCKKHEMSCYGSLMFGIPGETIHDIDATMDFLKKNRGYFNIGGFYLYNPIPGTDLWQEMKNCGMIPENFCYENFQLDFLEENFSWDEITYFNEKSIPFEIFRQKIEQIKKDFILAKPTQPISRRLKKIGSRLKKKLISLLNR